MPDQPETPHEHRPPTGIAQQVAPRVRRLIAPNASSMTHWGTNTYLVGTGEIAVIDPGPDDPAHLDAILVAVPPGQRVARILVTHAHLDHSGLAPALARVTGAPVLAFGDSLTGRSAAMQRRIDAGLTGGGEGVDTAFRPDVMLADGDAVPVGDTVLRAVWTPGHTGNHLCFEMEETVFTGDTVMGWAPSLVSPPDGDLAAYLSSCRSLAAGGARRALPGHGAPIADLGQRATDLIAHRRARESALRAELAAGPATLATLTRRVYTDIPKTMHPAAARNLLSHLIDLCDRGEVQGRPEHAPDAIFQLADQPDSRLKKA